MNRRCSVGTWGARRELSGGMNSTYLSAHAWGRPHSMCGRVQTQETPFLEHTPCQGSSTRTHSKSQSAWTYDLETMVRGETSVVDPSSTYLYIRQSRTRGDSAPAARQSRLHPPSNKPATDVPTYHEKPPTGLYTPTFTVLTRPSKYRMYTHINLFFVYKARLDSLKNVVRMHIIKRCYSQTS